MIVPSRVLKVIIKLITKFNTWTKISNNEYNEAINELKNINIKYKTNITINHYINIRNTYILLLFKTTGIIIHRLGDDIIKDYNNDISILQISKKYNFSPLSIIYQILIELKYESHKIEKMFKKNTLPKNIQNQISNISQYDPIEWFPYIKLNITDKLKKIKCKYNIVKINKEKLVLFDNKCKYNNVIFNWIMIKSYTLFNTELHLYDIQKTINKFKKYGNGVILYYDIICSKSFVKKIPIPTYTYDFLLV
jgi:hypothetical protein